MSVPLLKLTHYDGQAIWVRPAAVDAVLALRPAGARVMLGGVTLGVQESAEQVVAALAPQAEEGA